MAYSILFNVTAGISMGTKERGASESDNSIWFRKGTRSIQLFKEMPGSFVLSLWAADIIVSSI